MSHGNQRPPHSEYFIKELAKAGKYLEAQNAIDENTLWHENKADHSRALFIWIEKLKRGSREDAPMMS